MKVTGPIIMLRFLDTQVVAAVEQDLAWRGHRGESVVLNVSWSEKRGDEVEYFLERWKWKAPNIWQVM